MISASPGPSLQKLLAEGAEVRFHPPAGRQDGTPGSQARRPFRRQADHACNVQNDDDVARVFDLAKETYGASTSCCTRSLSRPIEDMKVPFVDASREGFKIAMDISVFSLAVVARHASRVLSEGGSILT